jgi:large subunit ribosomal protein L6
MSRIGKKPIEVPQGVQVTIDGALVSVKGPKGELSMEMNPAIKASMEDNIITLSVVDESKDSISYWGLTRSLLANMIEGVVNGHEKKLEIEGVGFKVELKGDKLVMALGFSHPVEFQAPEGIKLNVEKNLITVSGFDKYLVGQVAANIRKLKKPEPYKGKGIRYQGEIIRRKAGKKAASA